jgi:hypothetical protein
LGIGINNITSSNVLAVLTPVTEIAKLLIQGTDQTVDAESCPKLNPHPPKGPIYGTGILEVIFSTAKD